MSTKKLVSVCTIAFVVASGGGVVAAQPQIEVEPHASEVERQASPGVEPLAIVPEDLGISPNAADVWSLQCGPSTVFARADVNDNGGLGDGVTLRVSIVNPLGRAATQMAPDNGISPLATLNTGPGNYLVIITKLPLGALPATVEPYDSLQICQDALGNLTRESVQLIQDQ
jgi:hypothetical protein